MAAERAPATLETIATNATTDPPPGAAGPATLLIRLAETSSAVAATSGRKAKSTLLAAMLTELRPDEVEMAVAMLIGSPRQGSIGVGWATISGLAVPPAARPDLTIGDLDRLLSEVGATTGPGSVAARAELLTRFLTRATEVEVDFVRRLLIGDLRQGALAGVMSDAVGAAAGVKVTAVRRAAMLLGDLAATAAIAIDGGDEALAEVHIEVGRPVQPMLVSTAADVAEAVAALGLVQVDWKLDGARIQLHIDGDDVRVYTRNLNEVTDRLGHVVDLARALPCRSAVLDGEIVGLSDAEGPQPFQDTMAVFGSDASADGSGGHHRLQAFFFDLLLLDDEPLIDRPLADRSAALEALVGGRQIPRIVTDEPTAASAHFDAAIEAGHEGVMVKAVDGRYEAGRRGKSWRKVKPVHTLDLVVLAAEWGHGRRRGWLSNLHLGARDPESGEPVMVGKTFKGLTDELLAWQTEQFLARKVGEADGGHTVVLAPELVVEIALDGAQTSTRYPGGVALRFARVRRYRPDRDPATADTLHAVRALL